MVYVIRHIERGLFWTGDPDGWTPHVRLAKAFTFVTLAHLDSMLHCATCAEQYEIVPVDLDALTASAHPIVGVADVACRPPTVSHSMTRDTWSTRLAQRYREFICGLHGHDQLLQYSPRFCLRCASCGHETPGFDVAFPVEPRRAHGSASRRVDHHIHPVRVL